MTDASQWPNVPLPRTLSLMIQKKDWEALYVNDDVALKFILCRKDTKKTSGECLWAMPSKNSIPPVTAVMTSIFWRHKNIAKIKKRNCKGSMKQNLWIDHGIRGGVPIDTMSPSLLPISMWFLCCLLWRSCSIRPQFFFRKNCSMCRWRFNVSVEGDNCRVFQCCHLWPCVLITVYFFA